MLLLLLLLLSLSVVVVVVVIIVIWLLREDSEGDGPALAVVTSWQVASGSRPSVSDDEDSEADLPPLKAAQPRVADPEEMELNQRFDPRSVNR